MNAAPPMRRLLAFLYDRMEFDAIFAPAMAVMIGGLGIEFVAVQLTGMVLRRSFESNLGWQDLTFAAGFAAHCVVAAGLPNGVVAVLSGRSEAPGQRPRTLGLLIAPPGAAIPGTLIYRVFAADKEGMDMTQELLVSTVVCYLILSLPLIAAAVPAARSIAKSRVNAEAVFGGPA